MVSHPERIVIVSSKIPRILLLSLYIFLIVAGPLPSLSCFLLSLLIFLDCGWDQVWSGPLPSLATETTDSCSHRSQLGNVNGFPDLFEVRKPWFIDVNKAIGFLSLFLNGGELTDERSLLSQHIAPPLVQCGCPLHLMYHKRPWCCQLLIQRVLATTSLKHWQILTTACSHLTSLSGNVSDCRI